MNLRHPLRGSAVLALLLLSLNPAHAAVTVYTDALAFTGDVTAAGIETFFGLEQGTASASPMDRRTQIGTTYRYQASASSSSLLGAGTADETWLTANVATDVITFANFSGGITAFGGYFFGSDFNGQYALGDVSVSITDKAGNQTTQSLLGATTQSFIGFVSDGAEISSISLYSSPMESSDSLWPTARQLVMGQAVSAVPEPASVVLMVLGLAGIALRLRTGLLSPWGR